MKLRLLFIYLFGIFSRIPNNWLLLLLLHESNSHTHDTKLIKTKKSWPNKVYHDELCSNWKQYKIVRYRQHFIICWLVRGAMWVVVDLAGICREELTVIILLSLLEASLITNSFIIKSELISLLNLFEEKYRLKMNY